MPRRHSVVQVDNSRASPGPQTIIEQRHSPSRDMIIHRRHARRGTPGPRYPYLGSPDCVLLSPRGQNSEKKFRASILAH